MFGLRGIVSSLGLGQQAVLAATLLVTAFYVYRAVGIARLVSGVLSTVTRETLVLLVVGAVILGLGWASPNSAVVWEHVRALWAVVDEHAIGVIRRVWDALTGLLVGELKTPS